MHVNLINEIEFWLRETDFFPLFSFNATVRCCPVCHLKAQVASLV